MSLDNKSTKSGLDEVLTDMLSTDNTAALARLANLMLAISDMKAREVAVLWHLLNICGPAATETVERAVNALRSTLWARMGEIIYSADWEGDDVSQIEEIILANSKPRQQPKRKSWWERMT